FERLRDLLQRRREAEGETAAAPPATSSSDSSEPSASDSTETAETTAARPSTGTSNGDNPSASRNGQGQSSRTVACQNCVRPSYPQSALDAGAEGQPTVSVDINPDGSVRSVTLTRSSGNPAIDQAAIQAARNSRFQPVSGGASVPIEYDLTIEGSRRNRDARRRGDRQAVELLPEPTPTPATATTKPDPESTETEPTQPVDAAEPVVQSPPEPEPVEEPEAPEPVEPEPASPEPVNPPPVQAAPPPSPPAPSTTPPPAPAAPIPEPSEPSSPTPPNSPSSVEASHSDIDPSE
ncbi:MAG: energy transducer TonB, partial [Nodosilinea sp.]